MPVIFLQQRFPQSGGGNDVAIAVACSQRWSHRSRTVLLGDRSQPHIGEFYLLEHYSKKVNELLEIYPFQKTVAGWYLRITLFQWVYIYEWMEHNKVDFACCLDTDVLNFCDIEWERQFWEEYDLTLSNPYGSSQAPIFVKLKTLALFVEWLRDLFEKATVGDKERDSMLLWAEFVGQADLKVGNTAYPPAEAALFDHNLVMDYGGFERDGERKKIVWQKGQPHFVGKEGLKRVAALHCWGTFKRSMKEFVQQSEASLT